MNKKILGLSIITSLFLLSGCSTRGIVIEEEKKVPHKRVIIEEKFSFSVKAGENLKSVIQRFQKDNSILVVDKTNIQEKIIFQDNLNDITLNDLFTYLRVKHNEKLILKKNSDKIFTLSKRVANKADTEVVNSDAIATLPDIRMSFSGNFTYEELFNYLLEEEVKIFSEVSSSSTDGTTDVFSLDETVGDFDGTLKDLMERIKSKYKVFIEEKKGAFYITSESIKFFNLKMPNVNMQPSDLVKEYLTETIKPFEDLETELKTIVGETAKINLNKSTGVLTANGNYKELKAVEDIVENFNSIYSKNIKLELHIYEVVLDDDQQFGVNYSNIAKSVDSSLEVAFDSALTSNITQATSTSTLNKLTIKKGADGASSINSAIFNFLNRFGDTKTLTKPTLETANNIPVSINLTDNKDYIKEIEENTSSTTNDSTTTSSDSTNVTSDSIETGFQLVLVPKVVGENLVKVAVHPVISKLNDLTPYEYGSDTSKKVIQLKDTSERKFFSLANIQDGEMVLIGGYIYERKAFDKTSLPFVGREDSLLDPLTSTKASAKEKVELVFTIKATITDNF